MDDTVWLTNEEVSSWGTELPEEVRNYLFRPKPAAELAWELLSDEEKADCLDTLKWDLDFIAVIGKAEEVMSNEIVLEFLANAAGSILQRCSLQAVRCQCYSQMLMFAKIGEYMVGMPVDNRKEEEWEVSDEESEEPKGNARTSVKL